MKFSEQWLRSYVKTALSASELADTLTMAGLEVEALEPAAPPFTHVIVAQVLSIQKHENADRLNVCSVDIGTGEPLQIVCGASNVAAGLKVPCAQVGAVLPGDFKIKKAKVRGVESSGMLCAAVELGLAESSNGLLVLPENAPIGMPIRDYLNLDDQLFTLKLTPNRADCLSVQGIAREVAAMDPEATLTLDAIESASVETARTFPVSVEAQEACPLYTGRVIEGVNARAATPDWMVQRLERSGLRSLSALVDITNYVLLEMGQPLHAFDLAQLSGGLKVRFATQGEKITLLNEKTVELTPDFLVIADDIAPQALAGIMGGAASAVSDETTAIFLESAFFAPDSLAGKSRVLGFGSDSSYRFERGVDFSSTQAALERATALILAICGGQAGEIQVKEGALPVRAPILVRPERVQKILGIACSADTIQPLLSRLGLDVEPVQEGLRVNPPVRRFDLQIEEDLIEEIARLYGYDNIPICPPVARMSMLAASETVREALSFKSALVARDYQEAICYAFVDPQWEADFAGNPQPIQLLNPLAAQMSVMRSSLIGGLVNALRQNVNRRQARVRLFEEGRVFVRQEDGTSLQPERLAGLCYGTREPEQWGSSAVRVDFFDVKADIDALLSDFTVEYVKETEHPAFHPGRCAALLIQGQRIGVLGELHPRWTQHYDLPSAPVCFELELGLIRSHQVARARVLSKFPAVRRDLAFVVPESLEAGALLHTLFKVKDPFIQEIAIFDVYRGAGVEAGYKSLAFKVILQDTQATLTDAQVEAVMARLLEAVVSTHEARLR